MSCGHSGNVLNNSSNISRNCDDEFDEVEMFCTGSASIPRGFLSPLLNFSTDIYEECPDSEVFEERGSPLVAQCFNASEKL